MNLSDIDSLSRCIIAASTTAFTFRLLVGEGVVALGRSVRLGIVAFGATIIPVAFKLFHEDNCRNLQEWVDGLEIGLGRLLESHQIPTTDLLQPKSIVAVPNQVSCVPRVGHHGSQSHTCHPHWSEPNTNCAQFCHSDCRRSEWSHSIAAARTHTHASSDVWGKSPLSSAAVSRCQWYSQCPSRCWSMKRRTIPALLQPRLWGRHRGA